VAACLATALGGKAVRAGESSRCRRPRPGGRVRRSGRPAGIGRLAGAHPAWMGAVSEAGPSSLAAGAAYALAGVAAWACSDILTLTIFEMPGSSIVTPYIASAICIVRLLCVMRMNWEILLISRTSSL
jgi:hypothetical protein